jgi:hypothetical protein
VMVQSPRVFDRVIKSRLEARPSLRHWVVGSSHLRDPRGPGRWVSVLKSGIDGWRVIRRKRHTFDRESGMTEDT